MALELLRPGDPEVIGEFTLTHRLGAGGMGEVFLGADADGRRAAVKLMRSHLVDDPEFRRRFAREIAAAGRVHGRFTARLLAADADAACPWLATEFIDGPTLSDDIEAHGPIDGELLFGLAVALGEAIAAIHDAELVHRDLKPSNVMLGRDGPMVVDFGIARPLDASQITGTGAVLGSPAFMAPEQAEGGRIGPEADIFAWGATVAFAATGQSPFIAETPAGAMYRVVHADPDLSAVVEPVRSIVARTLAKDPAARPSIVDLHKLLEQGGDAEPALRTLLSTTWAERPRAPVPQRKRQRRWLTAGVAAGAAVVIAGVVALRSLGTDDGGGTTTRTSISAGASNTNAVTAQPPSTRTSSPVADVRAIDFRNHSFDVDCGGSTPITLVDGAWQDARGPTFGVAELVSEEFADATGDGRDDAIVEFSCSIGAGNVALQVLVHAAEGSDLVKVGQLGGFRPQVDRPGEIAVWTERPGPDDPRCCPSEYLRTVYRYDGRIFIEDSATVFSSGEFEARTTPSSS